MSFALIESALIERLRAKVTGIRAIHSAEDLAALTEKALVAPSLCVLLQDYRVLDSRSDGLMAQVRMTWLVIAIVKSVAPGSAAVRQARVRAGALIDAIATSLMGFRPAGADGPLLLATAPAPIFQDGMAYLGLAFTVDSYFKGGMP